LQEAARKERLYSNKSGMDSPNTKNFERELVSGCCVQIYCSMYYNIFGRNEKSGISFTKWDFHLQNGNLVCKTGFLFTKRDSWVTNGTLGLQLTQIVVALLNCW
jgi:hypothetical protein